MSETQSIALSNPDRTGGPQIGVLGGVGAARDIAKVAAYDIRPGENSDFDVQEAMPVCDGGAYISTATTTVVESGPCVLHSIVIGETAAGAITIYNNKAASGTIVAVLKASIVEGTYTFNRELTVGCTVVTAGASKVTVNTRKSVPA